MTEHDKQRIEAAAEKRRRKRAVALQRAQAQAVGVARARGEDLDAARAAATLPGRCKSLPPPRPTTPRKRTVRFYAIPKRSRIANRDRPAD